MQSGKKTVRCCETKKQMQEPGIEPGAQRWQRWILPLNHSCSQLSYLLELTEAETAGFFK